MLEEYPPIMSVEEVCEVLRMGYNAIYDLLNSGELKAFRYNGPLVKTTLEEIIVNTF